MLAAGIVWRLREQRPVQSKFDVVPITTYPGIEMQPSLSPDGAQVAFSWNGPTQQKAHIYVKAIGPGPPLQLTKDTKDDVAASWSPDGGEIAFLRDQGNGHFNVMLIPALGGPERKLTDIFVLDIEWMPGPYLTWTPDSRSLVLPDRIAAEKPVALFVFPVQVGDKRQLTFPPGGMLGDACAALSPDGRTLAFCRCSHLGGWVIDLYTVALDSNLTPQSEVKVPEHFIRPTGLAWNSQNRTDRRSRPGQCTGAGEIAGAKPPRPPSDRVAGGHRELAHYSAPFCAPGLLSLVWGRREHLAFADSRTRQSS